jgi:hypothetical protein
MPEFAAVPRTKSQNTTLFGFVKNSAVVKNAFRETKTLFCSELESLTLQLTKPSNDYLPGNAMDTLVNCMDEEFENPQFVVSLLAKLSRKLSEANVYTKVKSLIALHRLMQASDDDAQVAISKAITSLKQEYDGKVGFNFFSSESYEGAGSTASNVAELQATELLSVYAQYVFQYIQAWGSKSSIKRNDDAAERLMRLLELAEAVEEECADSGKNQIASECLATIEEDRKYICRKLLKSYESGVSDSKLARSIRQALVDNGLGKGLAAAVASPKQPREAPKRRRPTLEATEDTSEDEGEEQPSSSEGLRDSQETAEWEAVGGDDSDEYGDEIEEDFGSDNDDYFEDDFGDSLDDEEEFFDDEYDDEDFEDGDKDDFAPAPRRPQATSKRSSTTGGKSASKKGSKGPGKRSRR